MGDYISAVYATPEYVSTLTASTAIADNVAVDFELRGCPIDKHELVELISAYLAGRRPTVRSHAVCIDRTTQGHVCVMVA